MMVWSVWDWIDLQKCGIQLLGELVKYDVEDRIRGNRA